jgi:hypothetical protein
MKVNTRNTRKQDYTGNLARGGSFQVKVPKNHQNEHFLSKFITNAKST